MTTTTFRLVVDNENFSFGQAQSPEEATYFELVATVAALADDEEVALTDEQFHEILDAAGRTQEQFISDASTWGNTK